jgi:hypothetical protein
LIALAQRLFARTLSGSLQDGYAVANLLHYFCSASGKFSRRKNIREYRLCKQVNAQ